MKMNSTRMLVQRWYRQYGAVCQLHYYITGKTLFTLLPLLLLYRAKPVPSASLFLLICCVYRFGFCVFINLVSLTIHFLLICCFCQTGFWTINNLAIPVVLKVLHKFLKNLKNTVTIRKKNISKISREAEYELQRRSNLAAKEYKVKVGHKISAKALLLPS